MSGVSNKPKDILEQVRLSFEQFRRANKPRTRIPDELRQAAVDTLAQGVSMSALCRTCGLSSQQIADWQPQPVAAVGQRPSEPARVFEIADDAGVAETATASKAGPDDTLELRLGDWAITIRSAAA